MQKKRRAQGSTKRNSTAKAARAPITRRGAWKVLLFAVPLSLASFAGLAAYKQSWEETHDLSAIGNGTPTVVQVHDPGCALCRQLKKNTRAALGRIDGAIQYRIADLGTPKGRRLADRFHAEKVTLLTFDGEGKHLNRYTGVISADTLEHLLARDAGLKDTSGG